jgi:hypothetical protein
VCVSSLDLERGRVIIFTLGFDTTAIMARISELGIIGDDEFIFLVPEKTTGRSENTFLMIKQFMDVLNTRGPKIKYEFVHINEGYLNKSLQAAYDKLSEKKGHFIGIDIVTIFFNSL